MKRESLIEQVDSWVRIAAVVASYARGDSGKGFLTPAEMSDQLRLRWFLSSCRTVVTIEHDRDKASGDYWLGGFSVGGIDPYALGFRRIDTLTPEDMDAAEEVVKTTFPLITLTRCHFCEGHLVSENQEGAWICLECLDLLPLKKRDTFGYVYVFGSKAEGRYKIGQGATPRARMSDYKTKLPFPVEMIHTIPADDKVKAEADLHRRLRDKRENGEWFKLTPDELGQIMNLKGYNAGLWLTVK
jgi:hypothetical protein